jgi:hypothetical protein
MGSNGKVGNLPHLLIREYIMFRWLNQVDHNYSRLYADLIMTQPILKNISNDHREKMMTRK